MERSIGTDGSGAKYAPCGEPAASTSKIGSEIRIAVYRLLQPAAAGIIEYGSTVPPAGSVNRICT